MADPELKGEHWHKNNPDMKLYFEKPNEAEIADMEASKGWGYPITKNESIDVPGNQTDQQFTSSNGTGDVGPRPIPTNVEWLTKVRMTGEEEDLPEP